MKERFDISWNKEHHKRYGNFEKINHIIIQQQNNPTSPSKVSCQIKQINIAIVIISLPRLHIFKLQSYQGHTFFGLLNNKHYATCTISFVLVY